MYKARHYRPTSFIYFFCFSKLFVIDNAFRSVNTYYFTSFSPSSQTTASSFLSEVPVVCRAFPVSTQTQVRICCFFFLSRPISIGVCRKYVGQITVQPSCRNHNRRPLIDDDYEYRAMHKKLIFFN